MHTQRALLDTLAPWMPAGAHITLLGDRFDGTADLIGWCQERGWGSRLGWNGHLGVFDGETKTTTRACATERRFSLQDVELTGKRARTDLGILPAPGHADPWILAMSDPPGYLTTLEDGGRWGGEPMVCDVKSRGFGLEQTHLQHPDRLGRLILVRALAL